MRVDCHTHPLSHKYYYQGIYPSILDAEYYECIRQVLEMGIERKLQAIAITDHDSAISGLWARQYAMDNQLPLIVLPGCECEIVFQDEYVHILALNIKQPVIFLPTTEPVELVGRIKKQGGVAVLSHPQCYPISIYQALKGIVDGIEMRNGAQEYHGAQSFQSILDQDGYKGLRLHNSDYHFPSSIVPAQWNAYTEIDETEFRRWFGKDLT